MSKNRYIKNIGLLLLVGGLIAFGIVMIYSASCYSADINYGDSFYFVKKQIFGVVLGIVLFIFTSLFDYHKYNKFRWWILGLAIVLLVLVFVPHLGVETNGAKRWITIGGFSLQSSEVAKFAYVIWASCYMAKNYEKMKTFMGMLPVVCVGGGICLLVLLEPNLSVTLCIGCVMLCMLIAGGIRWRDFAKLAIPAILLVPILIIMEPYRLQRLMAFIDPWASPQDEGFQLIQSLYGLGAGGMFGLGLGNSRQKYLFLPFIESDFIFSVIGEELGFVGASLVLIAYVVLVILGIRIAMKAKDRLGSYMAYGIVGVLAIQTLINVAVVTGSIPPTGIPLPFISAGGTSLSVFMAAIGILVNISKCEEKTSVAKNEKLNIFHKKLKFSIK